VARMVGSKYVEGQKGIDLRQHIINGHEINRTTLSIYNKQITKVGKYIPRIFTNLLFNSQSPQ
jgi:hypothetical protein